NRGELERLVGWAADEGAVAFNCYFLVATGRGAALSDLAPAEYESVLADLARWERDYRGRMLVRAKCAPHFMRHVHRTDPDSPVLNYETRCPCGTQYCRITPDGKVTPCPYLPEAARARIEQIPSFVRGVVMKRVEDYARRQGRREVTPELLAEVRSAMPLDFSKKQPFFVREG